MSSIEKALRHIRFKLKEDHPIHFKIETIAGKQFHLQIDNCSLYGIGAILKGKVEPQDGMETDKLIPSAKITLEHQEYALGRLMVRRVVPNCETTYVAFSTVDFRIPIDGLLSPYVEGELSTKKSAFEFELNPDKYNIRSFQTDQSSNIDLFARTKQYEVYYQEWIKMAKYQHHTVRLPSKGERFKIKQFQKNSRNDFLVMGSNDYLGLASNEKVCAAAKNAIDLYGFGSTGSALTTGITQIHEELCDTLKKLFEKEEVLLFNSGFAANSGSIPALTGAQDLIVADMIAHRSIQDGMQNSLATSRFFKHNDMKHLEKILKEHRSSSVGALIITEGVFSMDGDIPPLKEIVDLARKYSARTYLDEAHSFGVVGPTGLGCWELFPESKVDIIMGTFSKICGGIGGFIAAPKEVIHWLRWYASSHIFSVSIPPSTAAAALQAINIFREHPELNTKLKANIQHFVRGLRSLGCPINPNHQSAVVPVIIGNEKKLGQMNAVFRENGVFVIPVIYPAVRAKESRFRFTVMASHSTSDLDYALVILEKAMQKADFDFNESEKEISEVPLKRVSVST